MRGQVIRGLNSNYTKTADMYLYPESTFEVNHIHGEIDNKDNPIIFGYGDELDESYKELSSGVLCHNLLHSSIADFDPSICTELFNIPAAASRGS